MPMRDERLVTSWREVLKTKEGRDVIVSILELTGVDASVFNADPQKRDYLLGRQAVGFDVIDYIKATADKAYPDFLIKTIEDENNERTKSEQSG